MRPCPHPRACCSGGRRVWWWSLVVVVRVEGGGGGGGDEGHCGGRKSSIVSVSRSNNSLRESTASLSATSSKFLFGCVEEEEGKYSRSLTLLVKYFRSCRRFRTRECVFLPPVCGALPWEFLRHDRAHSRAFGGGRRRPSDAEDLPLAVHQHILLLELCEDRVDLVPLKRLVRVRRAQLRLQVRQRAFLVVHREDRTQRAQHHLPTRLDLLSGAERGVALRGANERRARAGGQERRARAGGQTRPAPALQRDARPQGRHG